MKISEKQLLMLLDIAKDSLRIMGSFGGYEPHVRLELVNDLINQQSNELKEVDSNKKKFAKVPAPKSHTLLELDKSIKTTEYDPSYGRV